MSEAILLALLVAAALCLRLTNLGRLGLIGDEGHQALAVRGIIEHGVPLVPADNIYLRGAPFTYSEAAAAELFGLDESSLRLPAALFGAAAVLLVFVYGRMLFGTQVGLIAAFLLAFSVWELELSRYARMYTFLQLTFLASAITFYRGYIESPPGGEAGAERPGQLRQRLLTWCLMALAVVTHQLGIFVLLIYAIPTFLPAEILPRDLRGSRGRWRLLLPPIALGALWFVFHRVEGALMVRSLTAIPRAAEGAGNGLANGIPLLPLLRDHLLVPEMTMPLNLLGRDRPAVLVALAIALIVALLLLATLLAPGRRLRTLWALTILGAAFLNLFAVALGLCIAYLVLFPGGLRELRRRPLATALAGTLLFALYWGIYLLTHPAALSPGWGEPRTILQAFFAYPPVGSRVLSWFLDGWPLLTAVVTVTLSILLLRFVKDRRRAPFLYAAALVLLPLVAVTMSRQIYNESRYHFHLYPFVIVVFALALGSIARLLTDALDAGAALLGSRFRIRRPVEAGWIVILAILLSPDVAPGGIALLVNRDYTTPRDPIRAVLNWRPYAFFHQDHVSPAAAVRSELRPGDRVMVIGPTYLASIYDYYIGQLDYAVSEKAEPLYRDGMVMHHVTRARCIVSRQELDQVLSENRQRRFWILGDSNLLRAESPYFSPEMKARLREIAGPIVHRGQDLDTFVVRRDPAAATPGRRLERGEVE